MGHTGRIDALVPVRWGTPAARRVLFVAALGSGIAFLDGTMVNVALPSIGRDLDAGLAGLQWVLDAYLVSLTSLLLLGGALGDRYGRRRTFLAGVYAFTAASVLCGLAPTTGFLIAARALQGVGAALLVPGSLALLSATVHPEDRPRAVGAWSGLTGVASALGPFAGGWLVDTASWRWAFLVNLPLAAVLIGAARGVPESQDSGASARLDLAGGAIGAAGLALLAGGLISAGDGWTGSSAATTAAGAGLLAAFVVVERRSANPMLPLSLFRSPQFAGANLVTLAVYGGLGTAFFLVVLNLQVALGYSALEAGVSLLPISLLMLALSSRAGALAQRVGLRLPMTLGPAVVAAGLFLLGRVGPGDGYATTVFPAVFVFGAGLTLTVAPLTAAVLGAVDEHRLGIGSAVNNAAARLAGLLAVALLPAVAGVELAGAGAGGLPGYRTAMTIAGGLCLAGSLVALATIRRARPTLPTTQPSVLQPCHDPYRTEAGPATAA